MMISSITHISKAVLHLLSLILQPVSTEKDNLRAMSVPKIKDPKMMMSKLNNKLIKH